MNLETPNSTEPKSAKPTRFLTRRRFISSMLAGSVGVPAYMRWMEPHWLEVNRVPVPPPKGRLKSARPLRVLQLSDLHASSCVSLEFISRAITLGLRESPDAICLTGDFVTAKYQELDAYAKVLSRLSEHAPVFACLGNHDGGSWVRGRGGFEGIDQASRLLRDAGIQLLHNASKVTNVGGREVQIVGLGDHWTDQFDPAKAFQSADKAAGGSTDRILLSHNPDSKGWLGSYRWDLMLCGHTHGGQLELPFFGTPFAPVRDKRFVRGLHAWRERWIHITKGVGNLHGMRFNCRPEVSLLVLE